jgi:hypothetical protein
MINNERLALLVGSLSAHVLGTADLIRLPFRLSYLFFPAT